MEENVRNRTYVIGHKNPDTDSICSAIAYAYLKNQIGEERYVAKRAGSVSSETQYVLDRFHMEVPGLVQTVKTRVRDMEIRCTPGVTSDISLKNAWTILNESNGQTLPILKEDHSLEGLISIGDIARSYMAVMDNAILSKARTPYKNILETLDATLYVGDENAVFDKGKVVVAASSPEVMESYIEKGDMVILGNRYEAQVCAIEMEAGCIVICGDGIVTKTIQKLARDNNCMVIGTPHETYAVAHLINQSMPIHHFMKSDGLITFHETDFTDSIKEIMASKRYRDFPVVNDRDEYVGTISRRNFMGIKKRRLVLVDHNEVSQAVDSVEDGQIVEIIDHHRLGSLETNLPVYFRNQPVGCTSTIVYQMFMENGIEIPADIAGVMCSAILSDTLLFRSPTCTPLDVRTAENLAKIAGVECTELAEKMFQAGSNIRAKTAEQIFFQDFKTFDQGDHVIGVAQISSMSVEELKLAKEMLLPFLPKALTEQKLHMVFFMLTDISKESSLLLCEGKDAEKLIKLAFGMEVVDHSVFLPGVISRKKQLMPELLAALSNVEKVV